MPFSFYPSLQKRLSHKEYSGKRKEEWKWRREEGEERKKEKEERREIGKKRKKWTWFNIKVASSVLQKWMEQSSEKTI